MWFAICDYTSSYCRWSRLLGRVFENGVIPVVQWLLPLDGLYGHPMWTVPVHAALPLAVPGQDRPFFVRVVVRVLVYLKLYPVRTTCQKRFFYLNVINRVSVNGKSMVAILLLGFKVLVRSQTYLPHIPIKQPEMGCRKITLLFLSNLLLL